MKIIVSFFLCCLALFKATAVVELAHYDGRVIDLATYPTAKLFKGDMQLKIADKLDVKGIYQQVSQEKANWYLEIGFTIYHQEKLSQDIWIQLRSNVVAASILINDQFVFENGQVGENQASEIAGKSLIRHRLPTQWLKSGTNTLQIRFSNFNHQKGAIFRDISLGPLTDFKQQSLTMSTAPLVLSGVFLFAVIANLGFYMALGKKIVFIGLTVLFAACFTLMINESMYWNGLTSTVNLLDNTTWISIIEYLIFAGLILVMCLHFRLKKKQFIFFSIIYFTSAMISYILSLPKAILLSALLIILAAYAQKYKYKDSRIMLGFSVLLTIVVFIDQTNMLDAQQWVHHNFILTSFVYKIDNLVIALFALMMMVITSRRIFRNSEALHTSKLELKQLEFQFIQKHIQPHFLMNTLMSLQQLIKKNPDMAGEMIDALSKEFLLMTQMIQKTEVPIKQEIQMCRHYLKIMSLQHKTDHQFDVKGISGKETLPPATLHTIVENGLTHGFTGSQKALFTLSKKETSEKCIYILSNNGHRNSLTKSHTTGSGINYIESRLEQWHPFSSTVTSYGNCHGWHTVIELKLS